MQKFPRNGINFFLRHISLWLWTLFTAPYIPQYIHSALVKKITTLLYSDALCSIHMYCIPCCNDSVESPVSRFSFYSLCKFLFFLPLVLPLFLYLFTILCFSLFLQFHLSFSLPSLFIPSLFPSSFPSLFLSSFSSSFPYISRSLYILSFIPLWLSSFPYSWITLSSHHLSIHPPLFLSSFQSSKFPSHFLSFLPFSFLS